MASNPKELFCYYCVCCRILSLAYSCLYPGQLMPSKFEIFPLQSFSWVRNEGWGQGGDLNEWPGRKLSLSILHILYTYSPWFLETAFAFIIGVTNTWYAVKRSEIPLTDECTFGQHCPTLDFFPPAAILSWIIYMLYNKSCIDSPVLPKLHNTTKKVEIPASENVH